MELQSLFDLPFIEQGAPATIAACSLSLAISPSKPRLSVNSRKYMLSSPLIACIEPILVSIQDVLRIL
ncbi:hypothetical protein midi_01100 [Candidatus Midichloria mitochondrii IricVA]|uniref:Uncharacterized protein n=1 Tax=Midichloria mitochondrii (strain IricVA) TaxID=696127 RepID=F7XU18_MIDMI|nr:hypothetical protein midi_01100 [Candidatus Midichloria mitochondrii IricVA]